MAGDVFFRFCQDRGAWNRFPSGCCPTAPVGLRTLAFALNQGPIHEGIARSTAFAWFERKPDIQHRHSQAHAAHVGDAGCRRRIRIGLPASALGRSVISVLASGFRGYCHSVMKRDLNAQLSTVSSGFVQDWLVALQALCGADQFSSLLARSGIPYGDKAPLGRVTLEQIVQLYQLAAIETGDEMMGLWSRPIRQRALQHLLTSVRESTSLSSALYRFSTFWNLLLDEYQFELLDADDTTVLRLVPLSDSQPQRFGHMLILKLAHGILSWLARREVPLEHIAFAFERPAFEEDYAVVFPAPVTFGAPATSIQFAKASLGSVNTRSTDDLDRFLENAPRDWVFTRSQEHTQTLRVRAYLNRTSWEQAHLAGTAKALNMTPRTLIRKLEADGTSFQAIKDGLRRDVAIRRLQIGDASIEAIAQDVGFSSAASFHKAFRRWTGATPSSYRRRPRP